VLGASEITYLGHYLSARGIRVIPDRVEVIKQFPRPRNLRSLRRFIGMVGFYARFIPDFSMKAAHCVNCKEKGYSLTFRNPASYIKDEHTATFNTPHFLYFFNKYKY
jgi:hypothetical protein